MSAIGEARIRELERALETIKESAAQAGAVGRSDLEFVPLAYRIATRVLSSPSIEEPQ